MMHFWFAPRWIGFNAFDLLIIPLFFWMTGFQFGLVTFLTSLGIGFAFSKISRSGERAVKWAEVNREERNEA